MAFLCHGKHSPGFLHLFCGIGVQQGTIGVLCILKLGFGFIQGILGSSQNVAVAAQLFGNVNFDPVCAQCLPDQN